MKNKIIGYVVVSECGVHSVGTDNTFKKPTLWVGGRAVMFDSRKQAHIILSRTREYAEQRGFDWPWYGTAEIVSVRAYENR